MLFTYALNVAAIPWCVYNDLQRSCRPKNGGRKNIVTSAKRKRRTRSERFLYQSTKTEVVKEIITELLFWTISNRNFCLSF